ncbi:MAG TPA: hypothetical protein VGI14_01710 [Casimicrobiaceae bacterium]|jgi:hypothetical protein
MAARYFAIAGVALVSTGALAAEKVGPTWSEITGAQYTRTKLNRMQGIVKDIDGEDTLKKVTKIRPGDHVIRLQSPTRKGSSGSDQNVKLTVEPCKRYYLNAQFASSVGKDWEPVVDHVESIPGCKMP